MTSPFCIKDNVLFIISHLLIVMASISKYLSLFQPPYKEYGVEQIKWVNYRPVSQITNSSAIEFNIAGTSADYFLLSKTFLHVKVKIVHTDGTSLAKDEEVSLTNLALSSLFRQVDVYLGQQVINPSVGSNYPYKAYLDVLLNYNHAIKEGQLVAEGYSKDTAFFFDLGGNSGHDVRRDWTKVSNIADFEGPLHVDAAQIDRAILNGTEIGIKLYQSSDEFRLFSAHPIDSAEKNDNYKLVINDVMLKACFMKPTPSMLLAHSNQLKRNPTIYPYWKSVIKTFTVPQGNHSFSIEDLFFGNCPNKLVVGIVSSSAYSGSMTKNPFNFHHYNLIFLEFTLDGTPVPHGAFTPKYVQDPDSGPVIVEPAPQPMNTDDVTEYDTTIDLPYTTYDQGYVSEYLSLFDFNYPQTNANWIHKKDYPGGYCLYTFNVKPNTTRELYSDVITGHTRLSARFDSALAEPVVVVCYGVFPGHFNIDETRRVIV